MNQRIITKAIPSVLNPFSGEQVGEIATRANLPRGLASHHLRLLRAGRFLRTTRNGKQMIYAPRDERVLCILSDLIGHIVKPAADDDE